MARWLNLFALVVSVGLTVLFVVNLFTGQPVPKLWVTVFFLAISASLTVLSVSLLRQR